MRHIKYFNESSDNKEYYQQISTDEFSELPFINIDDKYVFILKELIGKEKVNTDRDDNGNSIQSIINISIESTELHTQIYQLEDEWFVADIFNLAIAAAGIDNGVFIYKCDQWDGLLECLKDNDIIK